jgi:hypothetical protein
MEEDGEVKGRKEEGRKEGGRRREEEMEEGRKKISREAAKALYLSNNSLPLSGQMDIQLLSSHWPRPHL